MPEINIDRKIIGNDASVRGWITGTLGLDENKVGGIRVNLRPGEDVTADVTIFLTVRDLQELGHGAVPTSPARVAG